MKTFNSLLYTLLFFVVLSGCQPESELTMDDNNKIVESNSDTLETEAMFDAELAAELGADEYGMRQYVMAFLKSGPNRDQDPEKAQEIQAGHMAHIMDMADSGKLVLAGPFMGGGEIRGIFVFDATMEEAELLTAKDPAVQSGRLVMELHPWYGSAALMQVNDISRRISKMNP